MRPHSRVRSACAAFCLLALADAPARASVPEDPDCREGPGGLEGT